MLKELEDNYRDCPPVTPPKDSARGARTRRGGPVERIGDIIASRLLADIKSRASYPLPPDLIGPKGQGRDREAAQWSRSNKATSRWK